MSIRSAAPALIAALLFGASTPLAKLLAAGAPPLLLAGLLYLGSGLGLGILLMIRRVAARGGTAAGARGASFTIPRGELPWLVGAIVAGGVLVGLSGVLATSSVVRQPPAGVLAQTS